MSTVPAVSLEASEFIAFATFRLWTSKYKLDDSLQRAHTYSGQNTQQIHPLYLSIISPSGTESWYPYFVQQTHNLLVRCNLPTSSIFIALLYIAQLAQKDRNVVGDWSYHHLLLTALILSQKQHSDTRYANKAWSSMTGISVRDINTLERRFLRHIKFSLHIREKQYNNWVTTMQTLGKEHAIVLKAVAMQESELLAMQSQLVSRPDLVQEIQKIRKTKTMARASTV